MATENPAGQSKRLAFHAGSKLGSPDIQSDCEAKLIGDSIGRDKPGTSPPALTIYR